MPADRLLNTVLRAYQDAPKPSQTDKILGTTNTLLTTLNNPLNLSLLTSHFLIARSIWQQPDGLRTCLRIISIFNTAAIHVRRNELDNANLPRGQPPAGSGVCAEDWARAIAKGLDDRSSRWQHTLVLAGVLMGMEGEDRRSLSWRLRSTLEEAVVTAANLALEDNSRTGALGKGAVVLALTYAFPLLSGANKALLSGNALLPAVVETMLGEEGFQHGDFIQAIELDIAPARNLGWSANSPSVNRIQQLESRPLAQNIGPLSRLCVFAVEHAGDSNVVLRSQDELLSFTAGLLGKWEHCALSLVDLSVESAKLPPETLQGPWPMLWQLFNKIMFAVVTALQPIVGRCLLDPHLRNDHVAPTLATKTLHALRNLSFVSSRPGVSTSQIYTFTYLTSLDIITRYPDACTRFLQETLPPTTTTVPSPVHQALTLFYLNTAEHLPLSLPTPSAEALIIAPATAHLSPTSWLISPANIPPSSLTLELFEASHASLLSVFSCPQHSALTAPLVPFYIDTLLSSFPTRISPRQFRLAFRTIMQVASPPYPISVSHPELSETLLEMVRFRAEGASTAPLPDVSSSGPQQESISEQTALVLALIDALPFLPVHLVDEWLSRAAEASNAIQDPRMRDAAHRRLWEVLADGELDVDRAVAGVTWWGTRGGRDMISGGNGGGEFMMSGALVQNERESSRL
ncbi:peroxin 8 [Xylaria flabelliformis]|nr:peroxin 8 [Xylaria flabelliformis]